MLLSIPYLRACDRRTQDFRDELWNRDVFMWYTTMITEFQLLFAKILASEQYDDPVRQCGSSFISIWWWL